MLLTQSVVLKDFLRNATGKDLDQFLIVMAIKSSFMMWISLMQKFTKFSVGFYASAKFRSCLITDDWFSEDFVNALHDIYVNFDDAFVQDRTVFVVGCLLNEDEKLPMQVQSERLTVFGILKVKTW